MRYVLAIILIAVYAILSLSISKGFSSLGMLISYLVGGAVLAPALISALFCIPKSGRNSIRFFRVFNVVLFFAIVGTVGSISNIYGKPPQKLVGMNGGVEITVHASWISEEVPNENVVFNLKNRSGYLTMIVFHEYTGNDPAQLEKYAQLIGMRFKNNVPDFRSISAIKQCGPTKMSCVYQVVNTTTGKKGTSTVLASLRGKDGFYNFAATTNPGLLEQYRGDIFDAMRSLKEIRH